MSFISGALVALSVLTASAPAAQGRPGARELAEYRLTAARLDRFERASGLIMALTRDDPRFVYAPLFTKEVALSGDAPEMATALAARLENDPGLAAALGTAKLTPREYATFALALVAAHLAHGFVNAGVLRVPPGVPTDNVRFVEEHRAQITAVLEQIGVGG